MKPKPFSLLNHFTVPVATGVASSCQRGLPCGDLRPPMVTTSATREPSRGGSVEPSPHLRGLGRQPGLTVAAHDVFAPVNRVMGQDHVQRYGRASGIWPFCVPASQPVLALRQIGSSAVSPKERRCFLASPSSVQRL